MQRNIFVYASESLSGKSLISFSLLKFFRSICPKVAFYRPVSSSDSWEQDLHIQSVINHIGTDLPGADMQGPSIQSIMPLIRNNRAEIHNRIYKKFTKLNHGIIICDCPVLPNSFININLEIANNLNCEIIAVINAHNKTLSEINNDVNACCQELQLNGCRVIGLIINRALPVQIPAISESLKSNNQTILGIIPEEPNLAKPSLYDIQQLLQAEILSGQDQLDRSVHNKVIAAKHASAFLSMNHSKKDSLVITPGDRQDILLSCIIADQSKLYPKISGILLTSGIRPEPTVHQIIDGISNCPPVLLSNMNTFEVAAKLHDAQYTTTLASKDKIELGCKHILQNLNTDKISISNSNHKPLNRYMLQNHLLGLAQQNPKHLVLPEGDDLRVLQAAVKLISLNAASITLIGDKDTINELASDNTIDLTDISIIDPNDFSDFERYAKHLYQKRKYKNMSINIARDMLLDRIMFATCMVDIGDADAMISGAVHTTSDTVRPALQLIKAKPENPFVCSIFVMCMQNKVVIYGDCALTINPDAKKLAHIAKCAAEMAEMLNIDPKVALLSYSSGDSGNGSSVEKVKAAKEILQTTKPKLDIAGPIQYDAAVDPKVGKLKLPNNPVAGQANVLIFPDLDTGNNTYKAVQREAKGLAIGPILLGLNKPVNDLSRGCEPDEIFMTALISVIQAQ